MSKSSKYFSYSESFKLKIVSEVEDIGNRQSEISRKYDVPSSTLRGWLIKYGKKYNSGVRVSRSYGGHVYMDNEFEEENKRLKEQLSHANLKLEVYEHMFDIGREKYDFDLKKKVSTKALKELEGAIKSKEGED